jgi:hypothetical protein
MLTVLTITVLFQTILALTTIFIIHQCVHFWGASTAQPGRLQFSSSEEVLVKKVQGNFNNVRLCNGRIHKILANESGVLALLCSFNNGGHVPPSVGELNFNISFAIPIQTSGGDPVAPNEVDAAVEVWGGDGTDVVVTQESDSISIGISAVSANTPIVIYF